jgi:hypothetical protein
MRLVHPALPAQRGGAQEFAIGTTGHLGQNGIGMPQGAIRVATEGGPSRFQGWAYGLVLGGRGHRRLFR